MHCTFAMIRFFLLGSPLLSHTMIGAIVFLVTFGEPGAKIVKCRLEGTYILFPPQRNSCWPATAEKKWKGGKGEHITTANFVTSGPLEGRLVSRDM